MLKLAREAVTQLKTDKAGKPRSPMVTNLVIYFLALFSDHRLPIERKAEA